MSDPSSFAKAVARHTAASFGGRPQVSRYWDDNRASYVDIVSCQDSPWAGVTAYGTVGLSQLALAPRGQPLETRVEILGACRSEHSEFANVIATAAFCAINSQWDIAPGVIFPDALRMYECSSTMVSLLFLPPFLWDGSFKSTLIDDRRLAWLMAVPISDAEAKLAIDAGVPVLEELFEERQIDIFDLNRASVC
jgi:antitoxin YqcF